MQDNYHSVEQEDLNTLPPAVQVTMNAMSIFKEHILYIEVHRLYYQRFSKIPNILEFRDIDIEKAVKWFVDEYKPQVQETFFRKQFDHKKKKYDYVQIVFVMNNESVISFDENNIFTICSDEKDLENQPYWNDMITKLHTFKSVKPENHLYIITQDQYLNLYSIDIKQTKLNLQLNYNDDFEAIHKIIIKRLNKQNDKGLILLHGLPGSGKTTYLRYLISKVKKKMIFVPPDLATQIAQPTFMTFLLEYPNSVLIIEDAENIITDRNHSGSSAVSNLLNLSDGLLSDCLNIQIICTFNTKLSSVDSALLRKGRLIAKYEFRELGTEKAQRLSDSLGFNRKIEMPMRLSDIYNQEEMDFDMPKSPRIGFS